MDWSHLEQGLAHTDNDKRIHALGLLKQELENSAQLADLDHLATVLRSSIKSNNAHVANAALACLPPFFLSVVPDPPESASSSPSSTAHTLKHAVSLLLPLDKLGDAKVPARQAARAGIVAAAQACLRVGGEAGVGAAKEKEGAWQVVERGVVESGFESKNAKAREQALHYVESLRAPPADSSTPFPPLRPYTPLLVPLLSDSDSHVRSLALQTTIHIFTHPSVSAPAKADLKKEMTKLEVAKKVQDQILAAVLGGASPAASLERSPSQASLSSAGGNSDGGSSSRAAGTHSASSLHLPPAVPVVAADGPARRTRSQAASGPSSSSAAHTPSLLASLPATAYPSDGGAAASPAGGSEISPVYLASERDLRSSFEAMKPCFVGKETEHNWQVRDKSVATMRGMLLGGVCEGELREAFVRAVKEVAEGIARVSASLRTTLALSTLSLISELFSSLPPFSPQVDLFLDPFLPHLLSMAGQTKKIVASASQSTLSVLLERSAYHLRTVQLVAATLGEKTVSARQFGAQHLTTLLRTHGSRSKSAIDSTGGADELEAAVKKALVDPNKDVKETARTAFWVFEGAWPSRAERVMAGLDVAGKKALEKARPVAATAAIGSPAPAAAAAAAAARKAPVARAPASAAAGGGAAKKPSVRELMAAARRKKQEQEASGAAQDELLPEGPTALPSLAPSTPTKAEEATSPASNRTASTAKGGLLSPPPASSPARSPLAPPSRPLAAEEDDAGSIEEENEEPTPEAHQHADDLMHSPSPFRLKSPLPSATSPARSPLQTPSRLPAPAGASRPSPSPAPRITTPMRSKPSQSSLASSSSASFTPDFSRSPRSRPAGGKASLVPDPVVDDALREQAMQAEQAAERLLELAEDEADEVSPVGAGRAETPKPVRVAPSSSSAAAAANGAAMQTPLMDPARRRLAAMGAGKTFEDSPDPKDGTGGGKGTWWMRKGETLPPPPPFAPDSPTRSAEISSLISCLQTLSIDPPSLRKLSALSKERPVRDVDDAEGDEPTTPSKTNGASGANGSSLVGKTTTARFWTEERRFEKVYEGLKALLLQQAGVEPGTTRDIALLLLKDLVENQFPCFTGEEAGLFDLLFKLREDPSRTAIAATEAIATLFTSRLEPLYGLGSLSRALTSYLASAQAAPDAVARSFALGLKLMGSLFESLPGEVLEDVLPGSKGLIKQALNDPSSGDLRRAAITALVSAQSVLHDEQRLIELVDGLERDQANLLSYYCAKRGV
ncbi:hypothetical protein JCM6882_006772 [Rhodosporidiobolus microsporus]